MIAAGVQHNERKQEPNNAVSVGLGYRRSGVTWMGTTNENKPLSRHTNRSFALPATSKNFVRTLCHHHRPVVVVLVCVDFLAYYLTMSYSYLFKYIIIGDSGA
jgi:hypothetical protein